MRRPWHHAGNPRRSRRLYRVTAESPERRQAGVLHRRQPCAEGRRLSARAATASCVEAVGGHVLCHATKAKGFGNAAEIAKEPIEHVEFDRLAFGHIGFELFNLNLERRCALDQPPSEIRTGAPGRRDRRHEGRSNRASGAPKRRDRRRQWQIRAFLRLGDCRGMFGGLNLGSEVS